MTKRLQQLLSWYLALSFAFAGAVAISPLLHQQVEHAGSGPAHTHYGNMTGEKVLTHHEHPGGKSPEHKDCSIPSDNTADLFVHDHRFDLPCISFAKAWVSEFFDSMRASSSDADPFENSPAHEHHSLPQLMASGLLDQALDLPLFQDVTAPLIIRVYCTDSILHADDWNPQTPSRGPPSKLS